MRPGGVALLFAALSVGACKTGADTQPSGAAPTAANAAPSEAGSVEPATDTGASDVVGGPEGSGDPTTAGAAARAEGPQPPPRADAPAPPPVREDGTIFAEASLMGTRFSMNVWVGDPARAAAAGEAMRAAFGEVARVEQIASEWRDDSEVSRLAAMAGEGWRPVSPELFELLERSAKISAMTDGRFDITFHGVGDLWSFEEGATPPTRAEVRAKLPLVDHRKVELDPEGRRVRLAKKGMKLGFGAIAKGYAVDRAADMLREAGFRHFIVEGGGDTFVSGKKDGKPWNVGIQDPDRRGAVGSIPASDEAIVTSGNYERYFEYEGERFAHIIDPTTGWPVPLADSPASVSLVTSNATDADALCTAMMVLGTKKGLAWVEAHEGIDAIFVEVDEKGRPQITVSSGLEDRFERL